MSTITKERVAGIASGEKCYTHDDVLELARIALASLTADPVGIVRHIELSGPEHPAGIHVSLYSRLDDGIELYTTPPAPVSVFDIDHESSLIKHVKKVVSETNAPPAPVSVPDDVTGPLEYAYKELTTVFMRNHISAFERYGIYPDGSAGIQAMRIALDGMERRAAMLQGAAGNSPAIPGGWVACSERMPTIGVPVITCCGDVVQYAVYAWDGKEWQDWYEEYDKLPSDTFTHWHPRPAAPQQEAE